MTPPDGMDGDEYAHPPIGDDGAEQCVYCGETFGGENVALELTYTFGPVRHAETSVEYDTVIESPPGSPLIHPECYTKHRAQVNSTNNHDLEDFR